MDETFGVCEIYMQIKVFSKYEEHVCSVCIGRYIVRSKYL